MSEPVENQSTTPADDPIARRLARLSTMPVDSSRVDAFIRQRIPLAQSRRYWLLRPMNAIAASLIGAVLIGVLVLALNDRPAAASPTQIAQWHEQMTSAPDGQQVMKATSVQDANQMLAMCDPKAPVAPGVEGQMSCCGVRRIGTSRISCLMVERDAGRVMVCIGDAARIRIPRADSTVTRNGVTYYLMSEDAVNIVQFTRDGRWFACSGKLPHSVLIQTGEGLKF
jgi:hypothetical protein